MVQKLSARAMANKRAYRRKYNAKPLAKKRRALNNKARTLMTKKYGKSAVKGKDVDHIKPQRNGGKTTMGNLRIRSIAKNRGRR